MHTSQTGRHGGAILPPCQAVPEWGRCEALGWRPHRPVHAPHPCTSPAHSPVWNQPAGTKIASPGCCTAVSRCRRASGSPGYRPAGRQVPGAATGEAGRQPCGGRQNVCTWCPLSGTPCRTARCSLRASPQEHALSCWRACFVAGERACPPSLVGPLQTRQPPALPPPNLRGRRQRSPMPCSAPACPAAGGCARGAAGASACAPPRWRSSCGCAARPSAAASRCPARRSAQGQGQEGTCIMLRCQASARAPDRSAKNTG